MEIVLRVSGGCRTGQVRIGQDRTGKVRMGQVMVGQVRTGQVRMRLEFDSSVGPTLVFYSSFKTTVI